MMNARFEQNATLIGVVAKKGQGTLDNGNAWHTDRVELHCVVPFPEGDANAIGDTVVVYQVEGRDQHIQMAKDCLGQPITLRMELQPAKKLGQAPKMVCYGFYPANNAQPAKIKPSSTPLPENVQVK
ncbi:hypothetical protein [Cellvibrio sp. UBA7661]|uniref:hypothetical protein n=1 Tax=Cellvibrio sp. UBA7661 TaxID=1946311 RepID=UPI002F35E36C